MKYDRIEIGDNIGLTTIIDEKFKSSMLTVRFIIPLDKEKASDNTIGFSILSDANSQSKTIAELSEVLSELYGSSISSFSRKRGDLQVLGITASWLSNRYAIYGEDIQGGMLQIFSDCLFSPNVSDGAFDEELFGIEQKELFDRIEAELNSKRAYAYSRAASIAFRDEPAGNYSYGTRQTAEAATAASTYAAYRHILETAVIEATYVSADPDPKVEEMLRKGFADVERQPRPVEYISKSPLKPQPETVSEEFDVRQCQMFMVMKTSFADPYALKLFSVILGETATSKLFRNVREKLSLCYHCSCGASFTKGALIVDSGVERRNIEKAKDEILAQLDEVCKGNITDEEINSSLRYIENALCQIGDTMASYSGWYFERLCEGEVITPQELFSRYSSVTRESLVEAAKSIKLDSVYLMLDKEEK